MVSEIPGAPTEAPATLPAGLLPRADGLYIEAGGPAAVLLAAVNHVYGSGAYLVELDYAVLNKALYDVGPALRPLPGGMPLVRLAAAVRPFEAPRRALYRGVKLHREHVEYFFEPIYLDAVELPDGTLVPERLAVLDVDEFIAELWSKGVRFGVDVAAVRAAIAGAKSDRITVARQLDPAPGIDARVVEVTSDLHRSDAPRERADGTVDLLSFQNRFPQIKQSLRLLKKQPWQAGQPGFDLAGMMLTPSQPKDVVLQHWAGDGTAVEQQADGEYLVATREGFLNVDAKSSRISITDKIVSTEGVSGRTTGNLELTGAYEEFGDVQELRDVNGGDITVHGDVYGNINSRGGTVVLGRNLVGGAVSNAAGDISVTGVASSAVLQTREGTITIARAENCVIGASHVVIEHASNCEILADTVQIGLAEGCAVAARSVEIESCGPRRNIEMLVHMLVRDVGAFDHEIAELQQQADEQAAANAATQQEVARVSERPDLRRYLTLAAKLRTQELMLTPEQGQFLKKIAAAVGADLQELNALNEQLRLGQTRHTLQLQQIVRLMDQRKEAGGRAHCGIHLVDGETLVRTMELPAVGGAAALYQLPAKEIKLRLRGASTGALLFGGDGGAFDWHLDLGRGGEAGAA